MQARQLGWAALVGLGAFLLWGIFGALLSNPVVLGDEWGFYMNGVFFDRLPAFWRSSTIGAPAGVFGYPWLIHLLQAAGVATVAGTKLLNAACLAPATFVLALAARRRLDGGWTKMMGFAAAFGVEGSFAAYIMPETAYYLAFIVAVAALWWSERAPKLRDDAIAWTLAGSAVGVATLLKPHGLLVFLVLSTIPMLWSLLSVRSRWRRAIVLSMATGVGFFLAFALGRAITAPSGVPITLDIFGAGYTSQLGASVAGGAARALRGVGLGARYLIAIALLLTPSLVQLVCGLWLTRRGRGRARPMTLFLVILLLVLTLAVANVVASEPDRLFLRYVDFLFPAIVVEAWRCSAPDETRRSRTVTAIVWLAAAVAFCMIAGRTRFLPVDAPELFFAYSSGEFGAFGLGHFAAPLTMALVASGALALVLSRWSWLSIQLVVLAPMMAISALNIATLTHEWAEQSQAARALGQAAAKLCGRGEDDVAVIASAEALGWVFNATWVLGRSLPLVIEPEAQLGPRLLSLRPGLCVLSSVRLSDPRLEQLTSAAPLILYRTHTRGSLGH